MGLIINLPNDVKRYASLKGGEISIMKQDLVDEVVEENDPTKVVGTEITRSYVITTQFHVWPYEDRENELYFVNICVISENKLPDDIPATLYKAFKETLHSYTDDI